MLKTSNFPITEIVDKNSLRNGAELFSKKIAFVKGVAEVKGLPLGNKIEVCFAGRSNVGKSSLINALTSRQSLARKSRIPGRTQEINFFSLAETYYLVDLPGYGYARAPINQVKRWQALLRSYLKGRASLRRVFLLIDSRHGIKPPDEEIIALLNKVAVTFQVVFTKSDKVGSDTFKQIVDRTRKQLDTQPAAYPEILVTSSVKKAGVDFLRAKIADIN